jgi:hypothetical protein
MAAVIYSLCALTCIACAVLLLRSYGRTRFRMLFWGGLCFSMLALSNILNMLDRFVFRDMDLAPARLATALAAVLLIVFGLIWEGE